MRNQPATVIAILLAASIVAAQSAEDRVVARDIVKKRSDAVVVVTATVKVRANIGGQEQTVDQSAQSNATVLDPSGLTVLPLSALQPDDVMTRSISSRVGPNTRVEITSEPSEIKIHAAGGREMGAKLVLRDQDLDLAFIRPTEPPASPMAAVDGPAGMPQLLDLLLVVQRTSESTGWSTSASFGNVQLIIDKPRTYYQMAGQTPPGAPLFDTAGRFVGVTVVRNPGVRGTAPVTAVLPANDIREIARQVK